MLLKMRKKIDIIKVKDKDLKKGFFLLLELIQLHLLVKKLEI